MESVGCSDYDLSHDSDYDLLEMISWYSTDEEIAINAWKELYSRHFEYLYKLLFSITKNNELAVDLSQETFLKVLEKAAGTFKIPQEKKDKVTQHVRCWLGTVAKKLYIDYLRGCDELLDHEIGDNRYNPALIEEIGDEKNTCSVRVREIYESSLDDREKSILDIALLYLNPSNPYTKIPKKELDEICSKLGITSENFRQIKRRALKKLKEKISAELAEVF